MALPGGLPLGGSEGNLWATVTDGAASPGRQAIPHTPTMKIAHKA
jgi:hypothetical protein